MPGPPIPGLLSWVEVDLPGGTTEAVGVDRFPGIFPEGLTASDDEHGSSTLAFSIRRRGTWDNSDLHGGNPIRYYHVIAGTGVLKWAGRIREDPENSGPTDFQITVNCDGAQVALDDDLHVGAWLISDFGAWSELRNAMVVDLNVNDPIDTWAWEGPLSGGQVTIQAGSKGGIQLAVPAGTKIDGLQKVGVMMDTRRYPSLQDFYVETLLDTGKTNPSIPIDFVLAGSHSPHFLAGSRVEYSRRPLVEMAYHEQRRVAPLAGIAPMPYLGMFLEHTLPVADPIPDPYLAASEFHSTAGTGPVTVDDPDQTSSGYELLLAIVTMTGAPTGLAPFTSCVTPPSNADWVLEASGYVFSNGVLFEVWALSPNSGQEGPYDWSIDTSVAPGGAHLAVTYMRFEETGGVSWSSQTFQHGFYSEFAEPPGNQVFTGTRQINPRAIYFTLVETDHPVDGVTVEPDSSGDPSQWQPDADVTVHTVGSSYSIATIVDANVDAHPIGDSSIRNGVIIHAAASSEQQAESYSICIEHRDPLPPPEDTGWTGTSDVKLLIAAVKLAPLTGWLDDFGESLIAPSRAILDVPALTPGLSIDTALVDQTDTTKLEALVFDQPTSPRQMIEAANTINAWRYRVEPDRRLLYSAWPTVPWAEVAASDAVTFTDAAGTGIADTYNAAYLTGSDALGRPVLTKRGLYGSPELPGYQLVAITEASVRGPSVLANWWGFGAANPPDGWGGALAGAFDYGAGLAEVDSSIPIDGEGVAVVFLKLGEGFVPGTEYVLTLTIDMSDALWTDGVQSLIRASIYGSNYRFLAREKLLQAPAGDNTNRTYVIDFIANDPWMHLYLVAGVKSASVDPVRVFRLHGITAQRVTASQLDPRGLRRTRATSVSNPLTQALAHTVADAFLRDNARPTFKGSISIVGAAARLYADHATPIPAADFLGRAGEIVWLADRVNPFTGTMGRPARIVAVSYDDRNDTATVTLDNTRHALDVTLARLAQDV